MNEHTLIIRCSDGCEYIGHSRISLNSLLTELDGTSVHRMIELEDVYGIAPSKDHRGVINIFPASMGKNHMYFFPGTCVFVTEPHDNVREVYEKTLDAIRHGKTPKITLE